MNAWVWAVRILRAVRREGGRVELLRDGTAPPAFVQHFEGIAPRMAAEVRDLLALAGWETDGIG